MGIEVSRCHVHFDFESSRQNEGVVRPWAWAWKDGIKQEYWRKDGENGVRMAGIERRMENFTKGHGFLSQGPFLLYTEMRI